MSKGRMGLFYPEKNGKQLQSSDGLMKKDY